MFIEIERHSDDSLNCTRYRFNVDVGGHGNGKIRAHLYAFTKMTRPSRRHKFQPTGSWECNRTSMRPVLKPIVPADVRDELHAKMITSIDLTSL